MATTKKTGTIFERLENKIDHLGDKAQKEAEKKVRRERILEMARTMDFWEKVKLVIKIIT
jgi:hypothetical protein